MPTTTGMKVLVFSNRQSVLEKVTRDFDKQRFFVCSAPLDADSMELVATFRPRMAVLDVAAFDDAALGVLKQLCRNHPTIPLIVCSDNGERRRTPRPSRPGASTYFVRSAQAIEVAASLCAAPRRFNFGQAAATAARY